MPESCKDPPFISFKEIEFFYKLIILFPFFVGTIYADVKKYLYK